MTLIVLLLAVLLIIVGKVLIAILPTVIFLFFLCVFVWFIYTQVLRGEKSNCNVCQPFDECECKDN